MGEEMEVVYKSKPAMLRAFQAAKDHSKSKKQVGDDFVTRSEFRLFLLYLRQYFEYFTMFK